MITIDFSVRINATKEKIWENLWSDKGYRQWTAVFMPGSYAESDWKEGSKIKFLSPKGEGMYSIIRKLVPQKEMIFEHQGEIKNGEETPQDWAGAKEAYYLNEADGVSELKVVLDTTEESREYFLKTFPNALQEVKKMSEQ